MPDVRLFEFIEEATEGCAVGPNAFLVRERCAGKRVVIFGLLGAFTPTCSARQVPGYVEAAADLSAAGIDEVWCVSVNDAFVMSAWGRDLQTAGKVKMIADGSARFTQALGLDQDLSERGMGIRSQRYAMVVENGVVKTLAVKTRQVRSQRRSKHPGDVALIAAVPRIASAQRPRRPRSRRNLGPMTGNASIPGIGPFYLTNAVTA
ncbi:Peroxiredoxin [Candidatus Paraburkholderia kirkii UZHbot1]|uniref:Glutathione-dependent peroxiredoxin n=1 Tax=Candidatus Paraburkholderia kirkii UZHbot1 TaxID=1055526 RepID=G4MC48_9BURK|nr:Peroxiredoxin [Candidatus Paraburkholderia kirkii UZHbot1]